MLWRSGKFQVSSCVVIKKLSYEKYDEMHLELINLHLGVSAPTQREGHILSHDVTSHTYAHLGSKSGAHACRIYHFQWV